MNQNPDQLSRLLLEADGLLLLLHRHRDDTPLDAIRLLRKKLELILALTDGLEDTADIPTETAPAETVSAETVPTETVPTETVPTETVVVDESHNEIPEVPTVVIDEPYRHTYVVSDNALYDAGHQSPRRPVSSIFNLNDKFRFRRELFANSDAQYVECLDMLSAMSSIDEAREYLLDDLGWDADNVDVKDFLQLLSSYYD